MSGKRRVNVAYTIEEASENRAFSVEFTEDEMRMMSHRSSRRDFLGAAVGLSAIGLGGGCSTTREQDAPLPPHKPTMKLSLSVRVAESFHDKEKSEMTLDELISLVSCHISIVG